MPPTSVTGGRTRGGLSPAGVSAGFSEGGAGPAPVHPLVSNLHAVHFSVPLSNPLLAQVWPASWSSSHSSPVSRTLLPHTAKTGGVVVFAPVITNVENPAVSAS